MAIALNQPDEKDIPQGRWAHLKLRGLPGLRLSHHFDYTDDLQALIWQVRIEPGGCILRYGMCRWDLGSAWDDDNKAAHRLKVMAEAELRKDLFLFHDKKKVPCSVLRITWIDSRGRAIPLRG